MTVSPILKTLEMYVGKECKVVFRDGGVNERINVFRGVLKVFDHKFQVWVGHPDKLPSQKCQLVLNHDDINRIVIYATGG